jgi:hypothetical protein
MLQIVSVADLHSLEWLVRGDKSEMCNLYFMYYTDWTEGPSPSCVKIGARDKKPLVDLPLIGKKPVPRSEFDRRAKAWLFSAKLPVSLKPAAKSDEHSSHH